MRRVIFGMSTIALAIILAGCAGAPSSPNVLLSPPATRLSGTATAVRSVAALAARGTPSVVSSGATTPTVATVPTVLTTPTITPTPGPPTDTPTPAPGQETLEAAQSVDQALIAFAQARSTGDTQATLQAQQKLIDAASAAAAVAGLDQTDYGQQLRNALDSVQAAATGDDGKLNDAHKTLVQIEGSTATPVVLPNLQSQPRQSLSDVANSLRHALDEYTQASNNGDQGGLLRAQRDLIVAVANAAAATKNAHAPLAQQIQSALTAIHDGLAGDTGKFQDAENDLSNLNNVATPSPTVSPTSSPTVSPTASPTTNPTVSPTLSPSPNASASASGQNVDLQPLQNSVDNSLQGLQNELNDQNKDNVQQAKDNLRQAIQQASGAVANDHSPAGDKLRDALGTAQAAASGDFTKIQTARDQLKAAVSGQ